MRLLRSYKKTVKLEAITSLLLICCTILSLMLYNSSFKDMYNYIFEDFYIFNKFSIHVFINDFLMAIFFLVAGLEIKHEILFGNLSSFKKASFPLIASLGGVIVPIIIFVFFTKGTPFLKGLFIPMSTDIAFAVGIFLIFSRKLHPSLKVFLLSLAVVDDLLSMLAIGLISSIDINFYYLFIALIILITLIIANKVFKITYSYYYLLAGLCLWYFIYLSGLHPTISGVLLAITIPCNNSNSCTLTKIQKLIVPFNSLIIIPLFALGNTGVSLSLNVNTSDTLPLFLGIVVGLCVGKPFGIMLFSFLGHVFKICEKPSNISWTAVFLVSLLAGIGFTMSIFISEIAFINDLNLVNISKISILIASVISILSSVIFINLVDFLVRPKLKNSSNLIKKHYIS